MKWKFYLRGFGIGLIFATIAFMIAVAIHDNKLDKKCEKNESVTEAKVEKTTTENKESAKETTKVTETTETKTEAPTEATTEAPTEATTKATTEAATTAAPETQSATVKLTISNNMYSEDVAVALQELGVITDSVDFDSYLENNNLASKLRTGEFEIPRGASYGDIAAIITRK